MGSLQAEPGDHSVRRQRKVVQFLRVASAFSGLTCLASCFADQSQLQLKIRCRRKPRESTANSQSVVPSSSARRFESAQPTQRLPQRQQLPSKYVEELS